MRGAKINGQIKGLGIVSPVPMSYWNAHTTYQKLNIVRHFDANNIGASYMAIGASLNVEPGVSANWQKSWMTLVYDGGSVVPDGTYPQMTVGAAYNANQVNNFLTWGIGEDIKSYNGSTPMHINANDLGVTVYTPQGSIPFADLPATPAQSMLGYMWDISDNFTTDSRFIEGAGKAYSAGTNVGVIENNGAYYYDVFGNFIDLSGYVPWSSVDSEATANTVPKRDDNGCIDTATPVNASNASNKGYTDSQSAISRYNLGAFDTYVDNGDGTATITRQTYYLKIDNTVDTEKFHIEENRIYIDMSDKTQCVATKDNPNDTVGDIRTNQGICVTPGQTWTNIENGVSYYNVSPTFHIQISQDFMGQALNTVEAAQEYFGAHPLYIQLKLATPYTEDVISERPINTLDQNGSEWVREEWEKGLNLANTYLATGKDIRYTIAADGTLNGNVSEDNRTWYYENADIYVTLPAGTYTCTIYITRPTSDTMYYGAQAYTPNSTTAVFDIGNGEGSGETSVIYATFTLTSQQSIGITTKLYHGSMKIMLVKGSTQYPYQPYHGGIIREDSTRLLRRTFIENNTSGGTMWHRVGSLPLSAISGDYDTYGAIFLISSIYNENFGASAGGSSSVIEFDVRKSSGNITNTPVSILSGNIPTNTLCSVITSSSVDLYIAVADLNNCKQITILSEATESKTDENIFVFNTNNDFFASAPSGAVYAVNRNTSSLEANGGTVNGNINVTGTVSEQGQRVYSPNNMQPYPNGFTGTDNMGWGNQEGDVIAGWYANGGSIGFRNVSGKLNQIIDGTVYVNEGNEAVYSPSNPPPAPNITISRGTQGQLSNSRSLHITAGDAGAQQLKIICFTAKESAETGYFEVRTSSNTSIASNKLGAVGGQDGYWGAQNLSLTVCVPPNSECWLTSCYNLESMNYTITSITW